MVRTSPENSVQSRNVGFQDGKIVILIQHTIKGKEAINDKGRQKLGAGLTSDKSLDSLLSAFSKGLEEGAGRCKLSFSEMRYHLTSKKNPPGEYLYWENADCRVLLESVDLFMKNIPACPAFSFPLAETRLFLIYSFYIFHSYKKGILPFLLLSFPGKNMNGILPGIL